METLYPGKAGIVTFNGATTLTTIYHFVDNATSLVGTEMSFACLLFPPKTFKLMIRMSLIFDYKSQFIASVASKTQLEFNDSEV